jgi:glycine betaine/proline transport system permease protein
MNIPPLPISEWINSLIESFVDRYSFATRGLSKGVKASIDTAVSWIEVVPPWAAITLLTLLALRCRGRKGALITCLGLTFLWNQRLWNATIETLVLIFIAALIAIIIGLPLGICTGLSRRTDSLISPVLDLMQTMPAYVYLIPTIAFFGLGSVSAIFSTILYAIAPIIRLTGLGIRNVPKDLKEAADAFGSSRLQRLIKLELPLAMPTILAGIQQTLMLALSMVVFSAMIGAKGLGAEVWYAIQRLDLTLGIKAGLGIVVLALIIDNLTHPEKGLQPCATSS